MPRREIKSSARETKVQKSRATIDRFWRVWPRTCRVTVDSRICARSVGQNGVNRPRDFRLSPLVANHRGFTDKPRATVRLCQHRSLSCVHRDPPRAFSGPSYMSYEDGMPAGGNSRFRGYPARMSERQQLALLLQMTSQEIVPGENDHFFINTRSILIHQRRTTRRLKRLKTVPPYASPVRTYALSFVVAS